MLIFGKLSDLGINELLETMRTLPFSYSEIGATNNSIPNGYRICRYGTQLGEGQEIFDTACRALKSWRMFDSAWLEVLPKNTPIEPDTVVAVSVHFCGIRWVNGCRIIYVVDETAPVRRCGFAYGTLPLHAAQGEERFQVVWKNDDSVWFEVISFSRPRHWLAWVGCPVFRFVQRRAVNGFLNAMRRAIHH